MIGLPGPGLRNEDVRLFRDTRAAGLILYRRNFETPDRLLALLGELESALGRRLLVATDHEGGRIVMLGAGTTIFPDNLAVGTAGDPAFARRQGYRKIRLWTNSVLTAARRIYEKAGYRLVKSEPHDSFGHRLVGETWEMKL